MSEVKEHIKLGQSTDEQTASALNALESVIDSLGDAKCFLAALEELGAYAGQENVEQLSSGLLSLKICRLYLESLQTKAYGIIEEARTKGRF